ncbi:unnamed protein product [Amaranthus hypochondriacus]
MAIELALEDDLFFADLNRQISLLIDEDDDDYNYPISHFPSISPQGFARTRVDHPPIMGMGSQYNLYQESCRRSSEIISKGTGVFIPQSSQPRRKYKQGKRSTHSYSAKSNNKQLNYSNSNNNGKTNANFHTNLSPFYTNTTINRY